MKKTLNPSFTIMLFCHGALWAATNLPHPESAAQTSSVSSTPPVFNNVSVMFNVGQFVNDLSVTTNKAHREAKQKVASVKYAQAIHQGHHVPQDVMQLLRTVHKKEEQEHISGWMLNELKNLSKSPAINLPNQMPPFLRDYVYNHTAFIHDAIDCMTTNPHIAEHVKRTIGYFYEDPENPWTDEDFSELEENIREQVQTYRVLDDALRPDADLTNIKFIVIPDVGATDEAIRSRTSDLNTLFQANPHLTLVVSFANNVKVVGDGFMYDSLSTHVKKLSFTGKNLKSVGSSFFSDAHKLQYLSFIGLSALRSVGNSFFASAHELEYLSFIGLSSLRSVGIFFFVNACALKSVNFIGLSALRSVAAYFFINANALKFVDFRGLPALKSVENYFFINADALQSAICTSIQKYRILSSKDSKLPLIIQE